MVAANCFTAAFCVRVWANFAASMSMLLAVTATCATSGSDRSGAAAGAGAALCAWRAVANTSAKPMGISRWPACDIQNLLKGIRDVVGSLKVTSQSHFVKYLLLLLDKSVFASYSGA